MVAKNKIHGRRMRQPLQQLHNRCFFQQLAVSPPGTKYVSVTAGTKPGLFILSRQRTVSTLQGLFALTLKFL
ncbi:Uncharacterised protein [Salmonella enterica subsp. arizonae]|nr:Uncharacterised protein [Salmonella enterica subsp. arizonae]